MTCSLQTIQTCDSDLSQSLKFDINGQWHYRACRPTLSPVAQTFVCNENMPQACQVQCHQRPNTHAACFSLRQDMLPSCLRMEPLCGQPKLVDNAAAGRSQCGIKQNRKLFLMHAGNWHKRNCRTHCLVHKILPHDGEKTTNRPFLAVFCHSSSPGPSHRSACRL